MPDARPSAEPEAGRHGATSLRWCRRRRGHGDSNHVESSVPAASGALGLRIRHRDELGEPCRQRLFAILRARVGGQRDGRQPPCAVVLRSDSLHEAESVLAGHRQNGRCDALAARALGWVRRVMPSAAARRRTSHHCPHLATRRHAHAVQLDEVAHDRQAESETAMIDERVERLDNLPTLVRGTGNALRRP
jgi:hypothetical protein